MGKLEFSFTGPWQVIGSADGGSYNIEHCHHPTWRMKKHAADLTPYPVEHISFKPVNGPNTQSSQGHQPPSIQRRRYLRLSSSATIYSACKVYQHWKLHHFFGGQHFQNSTIILTNFPGPVTRNATSILRMTHHSARLLCTQAPLRYHQCRHMFLNIPHPLLHPWHH